MLNLVRLLTFLRSLDALASYRTDLFLNHQIDHALNTFLLLHFRPLLEVCFVDSDKSYFIDNLIENSL